MKLTSAERSRTDTRISQSDKDLLATRLISDDLPCPDEAVFIFGRKKPCDNMNNKRLGELEGNEEVIKAINTSKYYKNFNPTVDNYGFVGETPLLDELKLKIGAKVMLRMNQDTTDGLTNGAIGWVVGFERQKGRDGVERITTVLVEFEEEKVGEQLR